jgi:hypothetical protein
VSSILPYVFTLADSTRPPAARPGGLRAHRMARSTDGMYACPAPPSSPQNTTYCGTQPRGTTISRLRARLRFGSAGRPVDRRRIERGRPVDRIGLLRAGRMLCAKLRPLHGGRSTLRTCVLLYSSTRGRGGRGAGRRGCGRGGEGAGGAARVRAGPGRGRAWSARAWARGVGPNRRGVDPLAWRGPRGAARGAGAWACVVGVAWACVVGARVGTGRWPQSAWCRPIGVARASGRGARGPILPITHALSTKWRASGPGVEPAQSWARFSVRVAGSLPGPGSGGPQGESAGPNQRLRPSRNPLRAFAAPHCTHLVRVREKPDAAQGARRRRDPTAHFAATCR